MKRLLVGALGFTALLTAGATEARAQRQTTVGVAAGASLPIGDLADGTSTGFHVLGTLNISGTATSPLGFRIDGMYNSLGGKNQGPDLNIWTVNGNLVWAFPGGLTATPYLLGGLGWYNLKADESGAPSTNEIGANVGLGARFALSGFQTFGEVRFHNVFTEGSSARLIPITFGILF